MVLIKQRKQPDRTTNSYRKAKKTLLKPSKSGKIRIGFLVGKDFDPIPKGTQDRNYPERFKRKNNTGPKASGWGGMFHIDVSTGLKMARLHPDIFHIDFMTGKEITQSRLKKNHLNYCVIYDVVVATYSQGIKFGNQVRRAFQNPECRVWPSYDYYDWICTKPRYMKQCMKAGIPMIETIFLENGFHPKEVLRKVQARGWESFFVKASAYVCYGNAAIHGKTQDFIDKPALLEEFAAANKHIESFLVQPYTLKPNGQVFDEIRNFFIDGQWAYSVYTDGTDDDGVYEMPAGPKKTASRLLSEKAYQEVLKVSKWQGKAVVPVMCRIDIGIIPDKGQAQGFRIFLNEIETEVSTWLARYCPFNLADRLGEAFVKKSRELLSGLLKSGQHIKDKRLIREALLALDDRLGPIV